jgi:hypothetical protein
MRSIITVLVTIPNDFQAAATVQANAEHCAASCFKGLWSFNCFHNDRNIPAISQATLLVRLASRYAHSRVAASWDELADTHGDVPVVQTLPANFKAKTMLTLLKPCS